MKQTQTKFFKLSDADLDLSGVSRAKMPGAFKKLLNTGYNVKTVSSVTVVGDQVTFTYSGAHGYLENRVLKVDAPELLSINNGEFVIDSVTTTTVTMTIDGSPMSIVSGFETKVAPLGWDLVYELDLVQLYKMRYLDERDLYVRFVFSPITSGHKPTLNVSVGKTADEAIGIITDENALVEGKENVTPVTGLQWMFNYTSSGTYEVNYTAAQGMNSYGEFIVVGSKYHLVCMCNSQTGNYQGRCYGIIPTNLHDYDVIDYPLVIGTRSTSAMTSSSGNDYQQFNSFSTQGYSHCYVGNTPVAFDYSSSPTTIEIIDVSTSAIASFLPTNIEAFNTFSAFPIMIYERTTRQFLGYAAGGLYRAEILAGQLGSLTAPNLPKFVSDEYGTFIPLQVTWAGQSTSYLHCFLAPVEEIKVVS